MFLNKNSFLIPVLLAGLAGLVWFSLHLALTGIYQVDECTEVYVAHVLALGQAKADAEYVTLFQILLSFFIHGYTKSADLFTVARFVMVEIFWLNLLLMALGTGEKLFSRRGLITLLGAATLAPLWDYGFQIRHDNLLLTGLLLIWCIVRLRPVGLQSYFIVGALAMGLEFVAFKSFAYTIPISLAVLIFPPPGRKHSKWKLAVAYAIGAGGTFAVVRVILGKMGLWELYVAGDQTLTAVSSHGHRFWPWNTLSRLLVQTPLLLALLASALAAVIVDLRKRGKAALNWDGILPEALLFLITLTVLMVNPAPFPYNLLFLVPFAFMFAFRHALALTKEVLNHAALVPVFLGILIFTHLVTFTLSTRRHLDWTNERQVRLMDLSENLTNPTRDAVFDGVNMVPTRLVDPDWVLHSFNIQSYIDGPGPRVRDLLATNPPAVFIPNYRTDWLPQEDHDFIRKRYVSLSDDFWVLGKILPPGGGTFEIYRPGRYRISTLAGSDLAGTYPAGMKGIIAPTVEGVVNGTLDGVTLSNLPVKLTVGTHRIECVSDCQPAVVWMGPRLDRVGRQGEGNHQLLFYSWF